MSEFKIGKLTIGQKGPLCFIADIAANHDGDLNRAYKLIELAKESGAHVAKFQNFQAAKIVSKEGFSSLGGKFSHQASWKKSVYETYEDASVPADWTAKLKEKCEEVGIEYLTSPYDFESIDQVNPYVDAYKIGSGDITWLEIIDYLAKKKKPLLLATGASSLEDVERAMSLIQPQTRDIVLMQCNTNYTASLENFKFINLNVLKKYHELYPDVVLGLSDHTHGHASVLGAIALGARVFEKHFTDDNLREGPDHKFAMNPATWREMVDRSNELFAALGSGEKIVEENEQESVKLQRRAIRAAKDLVSGQTVNASDLDFLRPIPEDGLAPYMVEKVLNKKLKTNIKKGDCVLLDNLQI